MDFKKSLNAGIEAAKIARENKEEILSVVKRLSLAIEDYSNGLVSLLITDERKLNKGANLLAKGLVAAIGVDPFINYKALSLVLENDESNKKEIIAEWRMNESEGYPCVISYNGTDVNCRNKENLERALSLLISHASTAERLLQLINDGQQE